MEFYLGRKNLYQIIDILLILLTCGLVDELVILDITRNVQFKDEEKYFLSKNERNFKTLIFLSQQEVG